MKDEHQNSDSPPTGGAGRPPTDEEFTQLLASNQDVLLWFVRSLLPGCAEVDDIVQESNLTLWRKRESFEMGASFLKWAKAVASWEVRAWLTREKRHSWLVINEELTDAIADAIEIQVHGVGARPGAWCATACPGRFPTKARNS